MRTGFAPTTRTAFLLWLAALAILIAPDAWQYFRERQALNALAGEIARNAPAQEIPVRVQRAVQQRVRWVANGRFYSAANRSLLRQTAWQTWTRGEGKCGEATRLMVALLRSLGYRATRINIYTDSTRSGHTAVVYQRDGEWFLLDSTGAPPGFNEWERANAGRPFRDMMRFEPVSSGGGRFLSTSPFFTRYSYYDATRITGGVVMVHLMTPPPDFLVMMLENPPLLRIVVKLLAAIALLPVMLLAVRGWRRRRRRQEVALSL